MTRWRSRVVTGLSVCILWGCATPGQVADEIVKSNVAQELAENQLLLLNILRASRREPMHFTQVTSIHLPVGVGNPSLALTAPFGGGATNAYSATGSIAVTQSVDITALNTQEFMRGITSPLPLDTMLYYIDQGWPREMILSLFVRSIVVNPSEGVVAPSQRYENYPGDPDRLGAFLALVRDLAKCSMSLEDEKAGTFGPPIAAHRAASIEALAAARAASMSFAASAPAGHYQFADKPKGSHVALKGLDRVVGSQTPAACPYVGLSLNVTRTRDKVPQDVSSAELILTLRSPEAMLYYLGEIARLQLYPDRLGDGTMESNRMKSTKVFESFEYSPADATSASSKAYSFFQVKRGQAPDCGITVPFHDEKICVPTTSVFNRSTHVLSLMNQIIALQNKGTELPVTSTVRVVP